MPTLKKNLALVAGVLLALGLAGCSGGGGSDSPAPVADDNPPAPAPAPAPGPTTSQLTIAGTVTDMPIPNATVIITVDGQSFEAPAPTDVDGNYTVEIETADPDAMVLCEAFDPNGAARFTAMLNNFVGLQLDADDDGNVGGADITNVTTAQFLLASRLTDDGTIDDIDELREVAEQVDADDLLDLSAAIKIVVENIDGTVLPPEFADVQELAEAIVDGESTFLDDVEIVNPGILDEAIDLVLSDGNATVEFTDGDAAGVYVGPTNFQIYTLFEDGSGLLAEFDVDVEEVEELAGWSVAEDGRLQIDLSEEERDTFTLLSDAGGVLSVAVSQEDFAEEITETFTDTYVRFGFAAAGWNADDVPGSYQGPDDEGDDEFTVLLEDGSGYVIEADTGLQDDLFTWFVDERGALVLTDVEDQDTETVYLLEDSTDTTRNILIVERDAPGVAEYMEVLTATYTPEFVMAAEPDASNTEALVGKTYAMTDPDEVGLFTFGAEGQFTEVVQGLYDGEWDHYEDTGTWSVDDAGNIRVLFEDETDGATVTSGLGADVMVIEGEDNSDGTIETTSLTRVARFEADALVGTWDLVEDGQVSGETLVLNADGSGSYVEATGEVDDFFDWTVDDAGELVLFLDDEGFDVATDTYYRLADSTSDSVHAVFVFRVNGVLDDDLDTDEVGELPNAVVEVTLQRQQ